MKLTLECTVRYISTLAGLYQICRNHPGIQYRDDLCSAVFCILYFPDDFGGKHI